MEDIKIDGVSIQPRFGSGLEFKSPLKFVGEEEISKEMEKLSKTFQPKKIWIKGKELAEKLSWLCADNLHFGGELCARIHLED